MDKLVRASGANKGGRYENEMNGVGMGSNTQTTLVIVRLRRSRVLNILWKSLFLVMVLLALLSVFSVVRGASGANSVYELDTDSDAANGLKMLPILLRDLLDEGLIKKGHKGFVLGTSIDGIEDDFKFLRDAGVDFLNGADHQDKLVESQVFDFVFSVSFRSVQMIDGIVKDSGLIISPLDNDPSSLRFLSKYRILYLRRFQSTVVAMRKATGSSYDPTKSGAKRVLCGVTPEKKKAALQRLEDVYLEPPRTASPAKKSSFTSRKVKFLPNLLKDSLDGYPRRVFISDDSRAVDWFNKKYPKKDQEFEVYDMEVGVNNDGSWVTQEMGLSTWLVKNVRREDYVVMKAEAQVVEEMLKDNTLGLVDELFLECKNQWQDGEGSKRAYWQCLALYGKVRDEGIAVHQWWN